MFFLLTNLKIHYGSLLTNIICVQLSLALLSLFFYFQLFFLMIVPLLHVLTGIHVIKLHIMKQEKIISNHIGSITKNM